LLFGTFTSAAPCKATATAPLVRLSLENDATIVTMTVASNNNDDDDNTLFVLSVEGHIYEISLHETDDDTDTQQPQPSLKLEGSWNTDMCGATCLAVIASNSNQLIIGYDSGYLEAWKVRKSSNCSESELQLQWRGLLDYSIRSVAPLRRAVKAESEAEIETRTTAATLVEGTPTKEEADDYFLVVTLQSEAGNDRHATASLVEILDLATVQKTYSGNSNKQQHAIPLYDHLRLPAPGMELVDSSTLPSDDTSSGRLPKRVQVLPSRGSDCTMVLSGGNLCGVALSDGTVALVSPFHPDNSWGVTHDRHQLLLSYPAVGCGRVNIKEEEEEEYLVCCLRGGTCFLIPTTCTGVGVGQKKDKAKAITVISYPHDVDADTTSAYVQGFTAGTLLVDDYESSLPLPVLVYAWAGGIIDIYACHLVYPKQQQQVQQQQQQQEHNKTVTEHQVLKEMIDNESLSMVLNLFDNMDKNPDHKLLQDQQWEKARKEVKSSTFSLPVTLEQLDSEHFESLRFLLLTLASQ
jgi:hypothetical protein